MGLMDKFNKGGVKFDINIEGFNFVSLQELYKKDPSIIYPVDGLYINKKSDYGDHPVAIVAKDALLVDLPGHATETVKEILNDAEVVDAIKAGKVGFSIHEYEQKRYKKLCYGINWEDINT